MSFYGNIFTNMGYKIEIIQDEEDALIYKLCLKSGSEAPLAKIPLTDLVREGSIETAKLADHSVTLDKINYKVEDGFLVIQ